MIVGMVQRRHRASVAKNQLGLRRTESPSEIKDIHLRLFSGLAPITFIMAINIHGFWKPRTQQQTDLICFSELGRYGRIDSNDFIVIKALGGLGL